MAQTDPDAPVSVGGPAADPDAPVSVGTDADAPSAINGKPIAPQPGGFWSDFGKGSGGLWGVMKAPFTESIPVEIGKSAVKHPGTFAFTGVPGLIYLKWQEFMAQSDGKPLEQRMRDSFHDLAQATREHPGMVAGSFLKGLAADPELFFLPEVSAGKAAGAVGKVAAAAGAGERGVAIAQKATRVGAKIGTAQAIGGGAELAHEMGEDTPLDPGAIGTSALVATLAAPLQVTRPKGVKLTPEEADAILKDTAEHGQVKPETSVEPTADGYVVRTAGGDPAGKTFETREEAHEAARELTELGSAYRVMDTVPRGTQSPSGERSRFIHENPFTPEKMAGYVARPGESPGKSGAGLASFWGKAAVSASIGAGIGAWLDRDEPGTGAAFGAAITLLPRALPKDNRISIAEAINTRNGLLAAMARKTFAFKTAINSQVPEDLRRAAISLAMEGHPGITLNPKEQAVADSVRQFFDAMGQTAVDAGVLKELLHNYVTHIVEEDPQAKQSGVIDRIVDSLMNRDRPSAQSGKQFAKQRKYATFDELQQALRGSGLKIKTGDIGEIMAIYSKAMFRAITDKRLLDALKQTPVERMTALLLPQKKPSGVPGADPRLERQPIEGTATEPPAKLPAINSEATSIAAESPTGSAGSVGPTLDASAAPPGAGRPGGGGFELPPDPGPGAAAKKFAQRPRMLLQPAELADGNYVSMPNKQLAGFVVHRDIAPQLNFIFSAKDPNDVTLGLMALNQASKRAIISFSLFHAKSLADAFVGAMGTRAFTGKKLVDQALKDFARGGSNDGIDALLKEGLQINIPEDASTDALRGALNKVASVIDQTLPVSAVGAAAKKVAQFNDLLDHFTFGYLQTGFKLVTGLDAYERLLKRGVPQKQAARMAASYANDIYGSLDWFRVANDVSSRLGKDLVYGFFNPNGRRYAQLLLFAPDWTVSTFRAAYKALPGAVDDPALAALHRRYVLKSAIYYLTVANAINLTTAGHSIFDNENPTRVQLGDGRTLQFSKHFMEPFEWLRDPIQTADNKLAFIPREAVELATGKEYVSAHDAAPDIENRANHLLQQFLPISAQQGLAGGGAASVSGLVGMPIYGKDPEQKAEARKQKAVQKNEKKKKAAAYFQRQHN